MKKKDNHTIASRHWVIYKTDITVLKNLLWAYDHVDRIAD